MDVSRCNSHGTCGGTVFTGGYYSSARYAKAAFTNVSNRLAKAIIQEQTNMLVGSMLWYGGSTIVNNFLMGVF